VIVTLWTSVFCPACRHPIRFFEVATVRVNKRSMRTADGTRIGAFEHWRCPGCDRELPRDQPLDREPFRLSAEDAAKVAEYRKRKWGIEDGGADVERVRPERAAAG
jgi:hypothetical protein